MAREYFKSDSSFIESAGYDSQTSTLGITFKNGEVWNYAAVPSGVWDQFKNAKSTGTFFHAYIKGRYTENQVE
jgi:lysyl-tRNA synthetase class 2